MSLSGLIPADLSLFATAALAVVALIAATARGFSGFGAALIFMPLASSFATPRLVAPLLLRRREPRRRQSRRRRRHHH